MGRKRPHRGNRRRPGREGKRKAHVLLTGTLRVMRPGVAEVQTPEGTFPVARGGIREGMSGDEVQVSLQDVRGREKLARVQNVVTRATTTFLGVYRHLDPLGAVVPLDARIKRDFFVIPQDKSAARLGVGEGDVVSARITEYPSRHSAGVVTIDRRVGSSAELDLNVESVIASYDLPGDFPSATPRPPSRATRCAATCARAASSPSTPPTPATSMTPWAPGAWTTASRWRSTSRT